MRTPRPLRAATVIVMSVVMHGATHAQVATSALHLPLPAWDVTLSAATRFVVLANFNADAVLDRETGLVWQRTPSPTTYSWQSKPLVPFVCSSATTGGRMGWRLPAEQEVSSLLDPSLPASSARARLPVGHPFNLPGWLDPLGAGPFTIYVAANVNLQNHAGKFLPAVDLALGGVTGNDLGAEHRGVWCVRGPGGVPSAY